LTISAQESAKIKKVNKVNLKSNYPKSLASTKTKSLNKALDLDKEQQVSVYNIFLEYFSKNDKFKFFVTEKKHEGRAAGATGWIVKPFNPDQLLAVIQKVIR
ncbi:MAG: hypothetical protein MJK04_36140, partial [Psychrosphaera sp.]|nr:hypothetical protein [Psychrosphaera sp.]